MSGQSCVLIADVNYVKGRGWVLTVDGYERGVISPSRKLSPERLARLAAAQLGARVDRFSRYPGGLTTTLVRP